MPALPLPIHKKPNFHLREKSLAHPKVLQRIEPHPADNLPVPPVPLHPRVVVTAQRLLEIGRARRRRPIIDAPIRVGGKGGEGRGCGVRAGSADDEGDGEVGGREAGALVEDMAADGVAGFGGGHCGGVSGWLEG